MANNGSRKLAPKTVNLSLHTTLPRVARALEKEGRKEADTGDILHQLEMYNAILGGERENNGEIRDTFRARKCQQFRIFFGENPHNFPCKKMSVIPYKL